jgi:hypothetical protein
MQGAIKVLHAALDPDVQQYQVLYLHDCQPKTASQAGRDPELAATLWSASNEAVGVGVEEDERLWPKH